MDTKYVMIIQCEFARQRCSGFACTNGFYNREDGFKDYEDNVRYIAMTCGGCCGTSLAAKLEHFSKKIAKNTDVKKKEVAVHLSSCMVTDNYHHDRCPNVDYIKALIQKKGYHRILEGTYISKTAEKKREKGEYKRY
ncbi:CGGC domain-containing protein [Sinanaerobacter sp. ZZT-01]|uniref:CGGC domain-containing protein n=1 Tax=Sinanaerobacter sp. ZZT-01 TaxID=3111540 RepID=UPI002D798EC0|nr:CGGC domain-containing protein [Sinanaerobacter sp. ZZT-01]WRR92812.1 CGGC domain-containing protein [Sinanaerobacter sp. ZZT-01]